jgi:hypothetical protein
MAWNNGPLVLYHGCDDASASNINGNGINLTLCQPLTDFGRGFYTTTSLVQAKNWANARCRALLAKSGIRRTATVIRFDVDRNQLAALDFLGFVTENSNPDFWDLIRACRRNSPPAQHLRARNAYYDVVFGPVTLWPQTLVIKDCDQISFHTAQAIQLLASLQTATRGQPWFP